MIRTILGVIFGYVAMFVTVFLTLTISYFILGADGAFQPNSFQVSRLWVSIMLVFTVVAALIGGKVCRMISGGAKALIPLVALVLVLGMTSAAAAVLSSDSTLVRTGEVSVFQAMGNAQRPRWLIVLLPLLCAGGVVIGGSKKTK